jgi:hypothetical protein
LLFLITITSLVKGYYFFQEKQYGSLLFLGAWIAWIVWVSNAVFRNLNLPAPFGYQNGKNQIARFIYLGMIIIFFVIMIFSWGASIKQHGTSTQQVGSVISGANVRSVSGRDTAITASAVVADNDVNVPAGTTTRIVNLIDLAGGWDAFVNRAKEEMQPEKSKSENK